MKPVIRFILISVVLIMLGACDPEVTTEYAICNKTTDTLSITVHGLKRSDIGLPQQYTRTIAPGGRETIFLISQLGFRLVNYSDSIIVFDSIDVRQKNKRARTEFLLLRYWEFSGKKSRFGRGAFAYELPVRSNDF